MKKILFSILVFGLLLPSGLLAGTYTPNHNFYKMDYGEQISTWWTKQNNNWDTVDKYLSSIMDAGAYPSINAAVNACGNKTTVITSPMTLTANLIVPSGCSLRIEKGGYIVKASTFTVTINGNFEAGLYTVFSGFTAGDVTFGSGSVKEVNPQWFGAKGDGTTDDTIATQAAIDSLTNGGIVFFPAGTYSLNLIIKSKIHIKGAGITTTTFIPAIDDAVIKTSLTVSTTHISIKDLKIDGSATKGTYTSQDGILLKTTTASTWVDNIIIDNVYIVDCGQYGISLYGTSTSGPFVQRFRLYNSTIISNTKAGLYVSGIALESSVISSFIIKNGDASNPNVFFDYTVSRVYRFLFLNTAFNHFNYPTTGTAVYLEHADSVSFINCDFESASPFIYTTGSLSRALTVIGCNFGSNFNVDKAIQLDDISGAVIENNIFPIPSTANYAIYSDKVTSRVKNIRIGKNVYATTIGTPVSITYSSTIATGAINAYRDMLTVDTEAAAATDDLSAILDNNGTSNMLSHGQTITIRAFNAARDVVVKHNTGNIMLNGAVDFTMDDTAHTLTLFWDLTLNKWLEIGRSE